MPSIFISGAAAGIGKAVAERFLQEGWIVGAYDITDISYQHPQLITGYLDVTNAESWETALAEFTTHTNGTIDVVDNNAGVIAAGSLVDTTPVEVANQINVNCLGVTLGAQAAKKYLSQGATLVNMASASAVYGQPGIATYSASKFYVAGLTEALSLEWRKDKIRVIALWPLWTKTALANNNAISVKRLGVHITAEEVADTVWRAVHPDNFWQRGRIHYGVSPTDKLFYIARKLVPNRVARRVNQLIAG